MAMTQEEKFLHTNELLMESPKPCKFKLGDLVTFTNENGISFPNKVVIGFAKPENEVGGRFVHISTDAPWFPCNPEELTVQGCDTSHSFTVYYPNGKKFVWNKNNQQSAIVG